LKLTSTLSQYLDGAPIEKKTVAKLVRRASLNAVPFDFKKDMSCLSLEDERRDKSTQSHRHLGIPLPAPSSAFPSESQDPHELSSSPQMGTPYRVDIPLLNPSHHNSCDFIYLGDALEEQCDYLFYRVYTLSQTQQLTQQQQQASPLAEKGGKDYQEAKRDVLNEWIGKRAFLSMCLALDIIDDRSVVSLEN
jgi:hypothetical protein